MTLTRRSFSTVAAVAFGLMLGASASAAEDFKAAGVLPGSITDQAFNQAVYEGLVKGKERLGIEFAYSEKVKQADQAEALADYARRGYQLVIAAGGEFTASAGRVAKQFPDTTVAILNGAPTEGTATINYNNEEFGYILGYIGGKMSKTGKAGLIAGQEIAAFLGVAEGFKKGWAVGQPNGEVFIAYTNDWDDVAKAKEATLNFINQGADVVLPYLDNGFVGVIQAAKEKDAWAVSTLSDLSKSSIPEVNLASALMDFSEAAATTMEMAKAGQLERKDYRFPLGSKPGPMGPISDKVPAELKAEVEKLVADMAAGKFNP
ncbi:MAG: BMP family protein [Parvibaculaceae bacterium]